jgi:hypothetical protein
MNQKIVILVMAAKILTKKIRTNKCNFINAEFDWSPAMVWITMESPISLMNFLVALPTTSFACKLYFD